MHRLLAFLILLLARRAGFGPAGGRHMDVRLVAETRGGGARLGGDASPSSCVPRRAGTAIGAIRAMPARSRASSGGCDSGWRADPLQYPVPGRLVVAGLMNYVFERDHALLATLHVPAGAEPGVAVPGRCAARLSGLHRPGLRPRNRHRQPSRSGPTGRARPIPPSPTGAGPCPGRWAARGGSRP